MVVTAFQVQLMELVDICTKHDKALSASSELHWDLQRSMTQRGQDGAVPYWAA